MVKAVKVNNMQVSIKRLPWDIRHIIVLHSSERYITFIALENCIDYFGLVGLVGGTNKEPVIKKGQELKVFRAYLNSIESLNNIIDYLYFDKLVNHSGITLPKFKEYLFKTYPPLKKINAVANAYKHCKRGRWKNETFRELPAKHAKDIIYDHDILRGAFKFWIEYINGKNILDSLPDIV